MNRFTSLFLRRRLDQDLAADVREHVLERTEELVEGGMDQRDAEALARREFGNITATIERSRDTWSFTTIESVFQDLRYGLRTLRKRAGFTAIVAVTLALGIGANSAIFGLIDGLWFHPMGVAEPGRMMRIFGITSQDSEGYFSYPEYKAIAEQADAFDGVVACGGRGVRITATDGTHELLLVNVVSNNFFQALGIRPAAGRLFDSSESPGASIAAVLGYSIWQRKFGGKPDVIGQTLRVEHGKNDVAITIVGVLPSSFRALDAGGDRDLWIPVDGAVRLYGRDNFESLGFRWFHVVGRLARGGSVERARSQVRTIAARLAAQWPASNANRSAIVIPDLDYRLKRTGANGLILISVAFLVVLLCCLNVANLLLARNLSRGTEFAVRLALGVHRLRLARQLMTENALLGIVGLALGLAIGGGLIALLPSLFVPPPGMTWSFHSSFDGRVVFYSVAVAMAPLIFFGVVPAWRASNANPARLSPPRLRRWLVSAQVAISLVLLAGSGALVKSLVNSRSRQSGYEPRRLLVAFIGGADYLTPAGFNPVIDRVRALPQVREVAFAIRAPLSLSGNGYAQRVTFPGKTDPQYRTPIEIKFNSISSNFLEVMGTAIVRGRGFAERDQTNGPLAVLINESMAQRFWPNENPIDKTIRLVDQQNAEYRIAGVVRNAPINEVGEVPEPYLYLPFWRNTVGEVTLVIHGGRDPVALAQPLRRTLMSIDPNLEPFSIVTFTDLIRFSTSMYQLAAVLVSSLGLLALAITAIGLYGVVSFSVSQRSREIGIRMALGAARRETLRLILRDVAMLAVWGMAIGLPCSIIAVHLAAAVLFGAGPWDAPVFLAALSLLAGVLFFAGLVPARRATRIEPMSALRYE